jgi:hypothetical protein
MATTIITKYSDYQIHSVEWFIEKINTELAYRDIPGLTNNKIEIIDVTKQHPLVALMAAQLQNDSSVHRSGLVPTISVTPGSSDIAGFTLGEGQQNGIVDDAFIANLDVYLAKTDKQRVDFGLLTTTQINAIKTAYAAATAGSMLYKIQEWRKKEEIHISNWGSSPDIINLMSNLIDSILAEIQVGFAGDDSPIVNFEFTFTEGLTNFNYGRVLFGTEYRLTFLNTFNNYTIYTEDRASTHEPNFTYTTPGE